MYPPEACNILEIHNGLEEFFSNFSDHRRLPVFYLKGMSCVVCGLTGNKIVLWYSRPVVDISRGGLHVDVFADDTLMTVDHIVPRSLGGNDHISNKQPMCGPCNTKKDTRMSDQDKMIALKNLFSMVHLKH